VRIDANLTEERLHTKRAGFVGHDRHHQLADLFIAQQL
jgi:hypothetical protein